jgi:multisubunit Na+/H+ antiporter MnhF subunit
VEAYEKTGSKLEAVFLLTAIRFAGHLLLDTALAIALISS